MWRTAGDLSVIFLSPSTLQPSRQVQKKNIRSGGDKQLVHISQKIGSCSHLDMTLPWRQVKPTCAVKAETPKPACVLVGWER